MILNNFRLIQEDMQRRIETLKLGDNVNEEEISAKASKIEEECVSKYY